MLAAKSKSKAARMGTNTPNMQPWSKREIRFLTIGWKAEMKSGDLHFQELNEEWYLQLDEGKKSQERQNCVRRFENFEKLYPTAILDTTNLFVTDTDNKDHVGTNPKIMVKATSAVRFEDMACRCKAKKADGTEELNWRC